MLVVLLMVLDITGRIVTAKDITNAGRIYEPDEHCMQQHLFEHFHSVLVN